MTEDEKKEYNLALLALMAGPLETKESGDSGIYTHTWKPFDDKKQVFQKLKKFVLIFDPKTGDSKLKEQNG